MKKILDLYITKVCNLNCEYCYVDLSSEDDQKFSGEDFLNRKNLLDYDDIRFFWWEPLIRWNDIVKIIESVYAKKPEITFVIVSNGLLIDKKKVSFCKKFNVKFVISVHGKWIMHLSKKLPLFLDIKHNVTFSFLFLL